MRFKKGGYTEALKKVRHSESVKKVSDRIMALTKTKDGDLLVRVNPGKESITPLANALGEVIGDSDSVKELVQYQKVVVQDLGELASAEEVLEAIAAVTEGNAEEARVISTIVIRRGQKQMVVSLPATRAAHVQRTGKLRVGYVSCRIRDWEERGISRCPRCLAIGHGRAECLGPNRQGCCRACGKTGHFAVSCEAS